MQTLKLEIEDSIFDKVMLFLKQLPKNNIKIELQSKENEDDDFISYLVSHPVKLEANESFLSRSDANGR